MANTYPVAQESYSKTKLQLKIYGNHYKQADCENLIYGNRYKKADCERLIKYANKLTVMIHAYPSTHGLKITHVLS